MSRAAPMGLAHFMVTAAGGTPTEGLADDRCALDGSPCVHAGRINSGRYACTESKTRRRGYALEAKRPRRLGAVKTAPLMTGGETKFRKTRHLALTHHILLDSPAQRI